MLKPVKRLLSIFLCILLLVETVTSSAYALCPKASVLSTMVSRVKWGCIFPLRIGGFQIKGGPEDIPPISDDFFCSCFGETGISMSFWEPVRLIEVVREPYCFPALNFSLTDIPDSPGVADLKHFGTDGWANSETPGNNNSFYNVHYYVFPIWTMLGLSFALINRGIKAYARILPDFSKCFSTNGLAIDLMDSLDLAIATEIDPTWNDDLVAAFMSPEAVLFGNPLSQAACAADCLAASAGFPLDPLFWCSGCWGGVYPFTGTVPYSNGGVESSSLLATRMVAKLNRELIEGLTTITPCFTIPTGFIRKSQYKLQLLYPLPSNQCLTLGRSTLIWGSAKTFPTQGEDFIYLLWRKKECCAR